MLHFLNSLLQRRQQHDFFVCLFSANCPAFVRGAVEQFLDPGRVIFQDLVCAVWKDPLTKVAGCGPTPEKPLANVRAAAGSGAAACGCVGAPWTVLVDDNPQLCVPLSNAIRVRPFHRQTWWSDEDATDDSLEQEILPLVDSLLALHASWQGCCECNGKEWAEALELIARHNSQFPPVTDYWDLETPP